MQQNFPKDEMFYTSNNERFRRNLYDVYLGGLDMEKFPRLFKRAIPFKMNIRLEDFVKEYICMEQDIHIEDMQEGAMLYGRMCRKIEATMQEIEELKQISAQYQVMEEKKKELLNCHYRMDKLTILQLEQTIDVYKRQEDLSSLMQVYEKLDLPVDESVIREFIHHEDVAEDAAAYFELYRKYRDDYGIADILAGKVRPETFARIYAAAFDERLSVVNLLLDGLSAFFGNVQENQQITDNWYRCV